MSAKLHGECNVHFDPRSVLEEQSGDGGLYQPKRTLHAALNYADASTRHRYRRKSGHRWSGRIPQGRGSRESDTYKCALNIKPFECAGATGSACALLNLRGNLRARGPHRKCTEVRCRALKNVYSQNAEYARYIFFCCLAKRRTNMNPCGRMERVGAFVR